MRADRAKKHPEDSSHELIRVNALHALKYCKRLFFLEEVEELYTQDDAVFAGRRLHKRLEKSEDGEWEHFVLESEDLGIKGKVDAVRTKNGNLIPYEHKKGRCAKGEDGEPTAWPSDRIQVLAYAMLLEVEKPVQFGRIRYHASNVTVTVPLDDIGRAEVLQTIAEARQLRESIERPPVTDNEKLCVHCSLAPICLPEEARLAKAPPTETKEVLQLFPAEDERKIIHVVEPGVHVGKSGDQVKISYLDRSELFLPAKQVSQIVIHGFGQISTQMLRMCATEDIGVHYISGGGQYIGSFTAGASRRIQRKIRQFKALVDSEFCVKLARQLVSCKADQQRQVLMRCARKDQGAQAQVSKVAKQMKILQTYLESVENRDRLRGFEGSIAALYFSAFPLLIMPELQPQFAFNNRNRRPPRDRVNALLSFGYALLLKDVVNAINIVGLDPAFGFYHQPRSSAPPLALDIMELFRVLLVDIPVLNSLNRSQWDANEDFTFAGSQVWLSDEGKKKFFAIYERRKCDSWKHPVIGYSLSYSRMIELEVRLLEKEWMNEGGLFAQARLR
jgi:CRISPR-associated protein Cas1